MSLFNRKVLLALIVLGGLFALALFTQTLPPEFITWLETRVAF